MRMSGRCETSFTGGAEVMDRVYRPALLDLVVLTRPMRQAQESLRTPDARRHRNAATSDERRSGTSAL